MHITPQRLLAVFAVMLLCGACATTYQPLGPAGGYYESQIGPDEFDVSFKGNPLVEESQVREYLLLRCAELTLEKGHDTFVIWADSSSSDITVNRATPNQPWKNGSSTINQTTVNPDVDIDTEQTWFTARYIIQTYPAENHEHSHAKLIAKDVLKERQHLLN